MAEIMSQHRVRGTIMNIDSQKVTIVLENQEELRFPHEKAKSFFGYFGADMEIGKEIWISLGIAEHLEHERELIAKAMLNEILRIS